MIMYRLFIYKKEEIQREWLRFVDKQDKSLEKALRQSVKNTLMDIQKRLKSDSSDIQPIFKIFTILEDKEQWAVVHEPSHDELTKEVTAFIGKVIQVTASIPQIERVFRDNRSDEISKMKEKEDDKERAANRYGSKKTNEQGKAQNDDQSMETDWRRRWELPVRYEPRKEYHVRINGHKTIAPIKDTIKECILNVKEAILNDAKRWSTHEQYRHLYNMRSERGRRRIIPRKGDD